MKSLQSPDTHHLSAALGWLGLGNWREANKELEKITPALRAHPDVLTVRCDVYETAGKYDCVVYLARAITASEVARPREWIRLAFALHELKRTAEAYGTLRPVVDQFPSEWVMRYNLACYACQLGRLKEAWDWLEKAFDLGDAPKVKLMALDDPDLEPLWADISEV